MASELELRTVLDRLEAAGFTEQLVVEDGALRATTSGRRFDPGELAVVEARRFEGATDPDDQAIVFALATSAGEPVGTYTSAYGPSAGAEDAAVMERLHQPPLSAAVIRAHREHDHVVAVFAGRGGAEAAVDELRELGLGSDRLGIAVRAGARFAFERDAELELERDAAVGVGAGAAVGFAAGFALVGLAVPVIGTIGVGGLLALGAASGFGGSMIGGYLGVAAGDRALDVHEQIASVGLEPDEVLVAVCSHGQAATVQQVLQRHGGSLRGSTA